MPDGISPGQSKAPERQLNRHSQNNRCVMLIKGFLIQRSLVKVLPCGLTASPMKANCRSVMVIQNTLESSSLSNGKFLIGVERFGR